MLSNNLTHSQQQQQQFSQLPGSSDAALSASPWLLTSLSEGPAGVAALGVNGSHSNDSTADAVSDTQLLQWRQHALLALQHTLQPHSGSNGATRTHAAAAALTHTHAATAADATGMGVATLNSDLSANIVQQPGATAAAPLSSVAQPHSLPHLYTPSHHNSSAPQQSYLSQSHTLIYPVRRSRVGARYQCPVPTWTQQQQQQAQHR